MFSNALSTTYHVSYNSCFCYLSVFFVHIYCISHLLESDILFSLVLVLRRFSYQLLIPIAIVAIVSATPRSYFYQHTVLAFKRFYHEFNLGKSTMYLYQVSYHLLVSTTVINYWYMFRKQNTHLKYFYQLLLCNY